MTSFIGCLDIHKEGRNVLSNRFDLDKVNAAFENSIELKVEVSNRYNNLFIESWSDKNSRTVGWFYTTSAKYLFYMFLKQKQMVIIKMEALRQIILNNAFVEK